MMVKKFIRECDIFQRQKPNLVAYPGYIQPLPIHDKIWSSISMDFIEGLPSSHNKTMIVVVVDRLSKYAHFMALQHPFIASTIAHVFLDNVYKIHGLPESIISDKDKTDGQTAVVNRCLECYHRCMISEKPKEWVQWLALTEFWYNTNFHTSIQTTPFEAVYGQKPPIYAPYILGESAVEKVDRTLQAREQDLNLIKFHLVRAQGRMRSLANKHKTIKVFDVGMWVYLKLKPHRKVTIRQGQQNKLSSKYYGPFLIVEKVGAVAYKLDLPDNSQVHHVVHVSQLKLCKGSSNKMGMLPHCGPNGLIVAEPIAILDRKMTNVNNKVAVYVLVKWSHHTDEDATWELYNDLL
ncbi:retrotransposable element Tf2 [Tanacetum coccineum]|uniref:Retrotransposable element Tf2 n=1 Tax=Tanacetum coccineum TaxID=301880 RepID=A0ABQ4ZX71_9ASTR